MSVVLNTAGAQSDNRTVQSPLLLTGAFLLLLFLCFAPHSSRAQPQVEMRDVAADLNVPVEILWGPDEHLWVAERSGRISRIDPETGDQRQLLQVPDVFLPESRGIFGMAMHPNFADSSQLFLYYTYQNVYPGGWDLWGKVVRYSYDSVKDSLVDAAVILDSIPTVQWNFGGGMVALPDHTLLIGTGDGVEFYQEAQSHTSAHGKILRIGFDGSIPEDNPWKTYPPPLNALWATGFRNPLGLSVGPSGRIYGTDWGTASLDEINLIEGGRNYGWPFVSGICDGHPKVDELQICTDSNIVEPVYEWYKAEMQTTGVADIGYYSGTMIEHWNGSLLAVTLTKGLQRLRLSADGRRVEHRAVYLSPAADPNAPGRLRALCISPDGRVFIGTSNRDGEGTSKLGDDRIIEILNADEVKDTISRTPLETRNVITGLHVPWDVQWGYDNWLWVTERNGYVGRVHPETGEYRRILALPDVAEQGGSGLLGMALHPNFCHSPQVFLVYCYFRPDNPNLMWERLVRYTYDADSDTLVDPVVYVDSIDVSPSHAGSRLLITKDREIFMTVSDGDQTNRTQDLGSKLGKILRLNIDGSVPEDNPWGNYPWPGNLVWSMGHRNPQGLTIGPNSMIYASEHGPWSDDEINIIQKGMNYGWPDVMGYCDTESEQQFCADSSIQEPIIAWTPTIAPAGLAYYLHDAIPEWKGSLLMGVLKNSRLLQIRLNEEGLRVDTTTDYYAFEFGRIRGLCVAPDGRVFFTVSNTDGVGVPREGDDRIVEIRSLLGHPPLPEPGALCDTLEGVDTVDVEDSTETGVHDRFRPDNPVALFPHPVRHEGTLQLGQVFSKGSVRIYDMAGVPVRKEVFEGGSVWRFVRGDLASGIYLVEIIDSQNVLRLRMMVE